VAVKLGLSLLKKNMEYKVLRKIFGPKRHKFRGILGYYVTSNVAHNIIRIVKAMRFL
jgi:hypothetical protein